MRNYLKAYAKFGVDLQPSSDPNNLVGCCPFPACSKEFHFTVGKENGAWQCFRCGRTGNLYTFLKEWHALCLEDTTDDMYRKLWKLRGIKPETLKQFQLAWDAINKFWLFPLFKTNENHKTVLVNLKSWRTDAQGKSEFHGTPTCATSLFNQPALFPTNSRMPVWICEGEWDALSLIQYNPPAVVLACPGAHAFKEEWVPWLADREVSLLFDNDEPGRAGARRTGDLLVMHHTAPRCVRVLDWPEGTNS